MIVRMYDDPSERYAVMRWDNSDADADALDAMGVNWTTIETDLVLRSLETAYGQTVTRSLLVEIGDRVTFTPLGWRAYTEADEALFEVNT